MNFLVNRGGIVCPIVVSFLAAVPATRADVTAAESFPADGPPGYTTGNLVGQGPASTGFVGNWLEAYGGAQSPSIVPGGLAYTDGIRVLDAAGGAVEYSGGGYGRAGRLLATPYGDATEGTVYFAFLIQLDGVAENKYRGFELHSGGFDDGSNRKLQIVTGEGAANPAGSERYTVRLFNNNSGGFAGDLGPADTGVNLFVGKITFSASPSGDSIRIWRNPSNISSEFSSTPVFEKAGFNLQVDRASVARFNDSNGVIVDEIRFGTSWSDVTTAVNASDTDGDGLPDEWEIAHGLDPEDDGSGDIDNGANGNPDDDGLVNSREYDKQTDPKDEDTDDDGLWDGPEVDIHFTDPLDPDSDGDFLTDGDEVNAHGTDPLDKDSDNDNVNDATEVWAGSDPLSGGSVPANARPAVVGLEHFDYPDGSPAGLEGGELFDHDNSTANDSYVGHTGAPGKWSVQFGNASIGHGRLATRGGGALRPFNGTVTGGESIALFDDQSAVQTLYAKVKLTRRPGASWSGLSLFANGQEEIFFGALGTLDSGQRKFGIDESGADNWAFTTTVPADDETYDLVVKIDCFAGVASLWVDPNLAQPESAPDAELVVAVASARASAVRLASGGSGDAHWDDLVVGTTWASLQETGTDSEPDGLRDTWEIAHAWDLVTLTGAGNDDDDTLTNAQEQAAGTNPFLADTDDDDVNDDIELANGTDPLRPDTDRDGLTDGQEAALGTDPLLVDTDGDGENDGVEVSQGTDPLDDEDSSASRGLVILDGTRDAIYGAPVAVQTVNTSFGDNVSEWNAAYAYIRDGRLHLMLTGNLEANFNKLEILIDSSDAVTTNVFEAAGNDGTVRMNGMTFDTGFSPDYHLIARRGGGNRFDLDIANLATKAFTYHGDVFSGAMEGSATSAVTGGGNASPIGIAYNGSNTAGVSGGNAAADPVAASAVATGLELSIALSDLGNPAGSIRIAVMQNVNNHDYLSNQILGGVPAPQGNLGSDGNGNWVDGTFLAGIDFNDFAGDQFFAVTVPFEADLKITSVQLIAGGTQIQIGVTGLVAGTSYQVRDSLTLLDGFSPVPGTQFTATSPNQVITLPVSPGSVPKRFFQIVDVP